VEKLSYHRLVLHYLIGSGGGVRGSKVCSSEYLLIFLSNPFSITPGVSVGSGRSQ